MRSFGLFLRRNLLVGLGGTMLLFAVFGLGAQQATAAPLAQVGSVSITCTYYSDYDRQFDVTFEARAGGAPSGTALLTNVDGTTTSQSSFTNRTTLQFRGPYLELEIDATWPDGATGFAAATCGRAVQPPTATAVAPTATRVAPTATRTAPSATATPRSPTATRTVPPATATTVPPAATAVAPATAVPPTTAPATAVPPTTAPATAVPPQPTVVEPATAEPAPPIATAEPTVQPTVVEATTPEPPHSDVDPTAVVATPVPATPEPTAPAAIAPNQGQQSPAAPAQAPAARPNAPVAQPKAAPAALPVTSSNSNSVPWLMLVLGSGLLVASGIVLRRQTIS